MLGGSVLLVPTASITLWVGECDTATRNNDAIGGNSAGGGGR